MLLQLLQMMIYDCCCCRRGLLMFVSRAIALQSLFVAALLRTHRLPLQRKKKKRLCHVIRKKDKRKLIEIKKTRQRGKGEASLERITVCSLSTMKAADKVERARCSSGGRQAGN